jgi:PilZ domain
MEKRLYYRQSVAFQVRVTVMADPSVSALGETLDISESGMGVCLPRPFMPGSLVQLEIADSVLQGFVAYCREWSPMTEPSFARNKSWVGGSDSESEAPAERPSFRAGIEVVEATIGSSGLSQLLRENFEATMPHLSMTFAAQSS